VVALSLCLSFTRPCSAQDIEPRRWTPLPVGLNVLGMGVAYAEGDIAFDPLLQISDATLEQKIAMASYQHAFDLAGKSARFDVRLPYQEAQWEGRLQGVPASVDRRGPGDPRLRLSVNFIGAPALEDQAYRKFYASNPVNTVVGAALAVTLPYGDYHNERLLNIGGNRFVLRPQLGMVHTRGPWSFELTGSAYLYQDNDKFFGESKREQDPLFALQCHLIYVTPQHWWVSLGGAHGRGGESAIDGEKKDDERQNWLYGISAGLPLGPRSSINLAYVGSRTSTDIGSDNDTVSLGYAIRF